MKKRFTYIMNKQIHSLTIIIGVLICLLNFGCKGYTCECVAYSGNNNPNPPTQGGVSDFTVKGTKSSAQTQCESHSIAADQYGNKTTCQIK